MLYLNKLLAVIRENSKIFKSPDVVLTLGITATQIKELKKYAQENQFIVQDKQDFHLTFKGEEYLKNYPLQHWATNEYDLRPSINVEYLKEDKIPSVLTKAIRLIARYFIEGEPLKEFSLEQALYKDLNSCEKIITIIEKDILSGKRILLETLFQKYMQKGITKSLLALVLLKILSKNVDRLAIYEKSQFQLKLDVLMFDRMIACPQNFEIQKTEMPDVFILKDISKIILNKKSDNILEITKGLYKRIKKLDKYVMNTQRLSTKAIRLRNVIVNAKDPVSLFERDIPKALSVKSLQECDREFLNDLKLSLDELESCVKNLVKELQAIVLRSFKSTSKEDLRERFLLVREYIDNKDLKVMLNTLEEADVSYDLWTNRVATFINKFRVPKDWSDEDYASFLVKTKELAIKFLIIESVAGKECSISTKKSLLLLENFSKLSESEKIFFQRKIVNDL